jgi:hypothetical protein
VGKLIDSKLDALGNITELFKPNITIPHLPALNLKSHLDEVRGQTGTRMRGRGRGCVVLCAPLSASASARAWFWV